MSFIWHVSRTGLYLATIEAYRPSLGGEACSLQNQNKTLAWVENIR